LWEQVSYRELSVAAAVGGGSRLHVCDRGRIYPARSLQRGHDALRGLIAGHPAQPLQRTGPLAKHQGAGYRGGASKHLPTVHRALTRRRVRRGLLKRRGGPADVGWHLNTVLVRGGDQLDKVDAGFKREAPKLASELPGRADCRRTPQRDDLR
jgi:hypothetical protein